MKIACDRRDGSLSSAVGHRYLGGVCFRVTAGWHGTTAVGAIQSRAGRVPYDRFPPRAER